MVLGVGGAILFLFTYIATRFVWLLRFVWLVRAIGSRMAYRTSKVTAPILPTSPTHRQKTLYIYTFLLYINYVVCVDIDIDIDMSDVDVYM